LAPLNLFGISPILRRPNKGQGLWRWCGKKHIKSVAIQNVSNKNPFINLVCLSYILIAVYFIMVFIFRQSSANEYNFLNRFWGFDNITFYSPSIIFIAYALAIIVCIPYFNNKITSLFSSSFITKQLFSLKKCKYLIFVLLSVLSFFIFYMFPIKHHFLGDLDIRVNQTVKGEFVGTEYGTMFILNHIFQILHSEFNYTGIQIFVLMSTIALKINMPLAATKNIRVNIFTF